VARRPLLRGHSHQFAEQRVQQRRVGDDAIPRRCEGQPTQHGHLHDRHHLAGLRPQHGKAKNAVGIAATSAFMDAEIE
jgi:hypothetical protein